MCSSAGGPQAKATCCEHCHSYLSSTPASRRFSMCDCRKEVLREAKPNSCRCQSSCLRATASCSSAKVGGERDACQQGIRAPALGKYGCPCFMGMLYILISKQRRLGSILRAVSNEGHVCTPWRVLQPQGTSTLTLLLCLQRHPHGSFPSLRASPVISTPITVPLGPTSCAITNTSRPEPQPRSSVVSPCRSVRGMRTDTSPLLLPPPSAQRAGRLCL